MKKYNSRDEKGITIIALIVTIIALLILVTITISTITGNHAIINKSADAKNSTELKSEMELLRVAANTVRGKDRYGNLSFSLLKNELDYSAGENQTKVTEELDGNEKIGFKVKFLKSGRYYFLYNEDGEADIIFCGNEGIDNNKGILNANPRRKTVLINTTERVEGLLRTFSSIDKNNIKIYYGWSKSSIDEPDYTEIASNEIGGNGFDKRFLINYPNETGEYYLCLKATISEETTISKKFGEYKVIPEGVIPEYIVTFKKGKYVASIGEESIVTTGEVTLPSIIPNEQCEVLGWYNGDTLVGMPGKKINVSKSITLTAMARNTKAPTVVVAREDYNTFRWTATDVVPISGYQISKSSEMPSATGNGWTDGNINTGTYDISDEGTYYVYVKNEDGIVGQGMINAYTVSRNQGIGTTLTTKLESSSGDDFTETTKVLEGTTIYVVGSLSKGYQGLVLKKDNITILGGNQTIASNTNFSSTASPCIYKIVFDNNYPNNISDLSGSMAPIENIKYGESKTLTKNAFVVTQAGVPSKQLFEEWNTKADGSGISYEDGASVSNLTDEHNGVVTLYAQWTDANYEISSPVKYTETLEEAIAVANTPSVIKLITSSINDNSTANVGKTLTLNLNNNTLIRDSAINVTNGTFTLKGSSDSSVGGKLKSNDIGIYNSGTTSSVRISNYAEIQSQKTSISFLDQSNCTGFLHIDDSWVHSEFEGANEPTNRYATISIGSARDVTITNSWIYNSYSAENVIYVGYELPQMTIRGKSRIGNRNVEDGTGFEKAVLYFANADAPTVDINITGNTILMAGGHTLNTIRSYRTARINIIQEAELYVLSSNPPSCCINARGEGSTIYIETSGWVYSCGNFCIDSVEPQNVTLTRGSFTSKSIYTVCDNEAYNSKYDHTSEHALYYMSSYNSLGTSGDRSLYHSGYGWTKNGSSDVYNWRYHENGILIVGWKQVDGIWYYFWVLDGTQTLGPGDTTNYAEGERVKGWLKDNNDWFYLWNSEDPLELKDNTVTYSEYEMVTGMIKIYDHWYYFDNNGRMKTGWVQVGDYWYYFDNNGYMKTGWLQLSGKWYYFDSDGHMVTGSKEIDGKTYYFGSDGVCTNP